jgi:2-hydroxy-3-keto-5-methylthiopentenyl-1-phosphate phosphatase
LIAQLRDRGAEVAVLSDGFGFYADEVCERLGVQVLTNAVDWSSGTLEFPNLDRCCPCSSCGTCKQAPIKDARRRGRTAIFVGDGVSDRKAALLADVLFAKGRLAEWCEFSGVEHVPFDTLAEVYSVLCK